MVTQKEIRECIESSLEVYKQAKLITSYSVKHRDRFFTKHSDFTVRIMINDVVVVEVSEEERKNDLAGLRRRTYQKALGALLLDSYNFFIYEKYQPQGVPN